MKRKNILGLLAFSALFAGLIPRVYADHLVSRIMIKGSQINLKGCGGTLAVIGWGSSSPWIDLRDVENCSYVQVLDLNGNVIFPESTGASLPAGASNEAKNAADPSLAQSYTIPFAGDFRSGGFYITQSILDRAATILIRSNSGDTTALIAMPGHKEPSQMKVDSSLNF